jgi:hypothetical protein
MDTSVIGQANAQSGGTATATAQYNACGYWYYNPLTLTCTCSNNTSGSGNSAAIVVQITAPSNTVWWFNGQTPSGYTTTLTLTALPAGGTTYDWSVLAGTDKASISGYPSANEANIVGNDLSTSQGDVTVQCHVTANGVNGSASTDLTVHGPYQLAPGQVVDQADSTYGYVCFLNYSVKDNMGQLLPSAVYINEYWTTSVVADYAGTNWRRDGAGSYSMPSSTFADQIGGEASTMTPTPSAP